jgi:vancomycin aglycone glucosyltransferase
VRFVVAGYGSRGDVEPCLAVAGELARRGHDVVLAMTVQADMLAFLDSAGLTAVPYGPDWQAQLRDEDFVGMLQNLVGSIPQAIQYTAQVWSDKSETLLSVTDGADLLVAGMTEQGIAANIADYQGIPLAALHFFPPQILEHGSPQESVTSQAEVALRRRLGLPDEPEASARPLEIQAYDEVCAPDLAAEWAAKGKRRPFVGALTLQLPTNADGEVLPWIGAGRPPVYFGFGSTPLAAPADTVAVISAACARFGERALINLGPNDITAIQCQDHVKVVNEANHATVFPGCAAVVHHGGAGTTAAGLRAGKPSLILWNGLDQPFWANAVKRLGIGFGRRFAESTLDSLIADLHEILARHYTVRGREVAALTTQPAESLANTADLLEDAARRGRED